jgi:hypothetical protein
MLAFVLALKLSTILILAWAFYRPKELVRSGGRSRGVLVVALVHFLLALLSLQGEKSSVAELFIAYPLLWSVLLRNRLRGLLPCPAPIWLMAVAICLLLWFEETWVIVDFRTPPLRHYAHYFGFYVGTTATLLLLYSCYRFTPQETFFVGGLWGVLIEQQFGGPKLLLSGEVDKALLFAVYVFPVYGLYLAAPRLLFFEEFSRPTRTSRWQTLLLFVAITVLPLLVWAAWSAILKAFGFDPAGVEFLA